MNNNRIAALDSLRGLAAIFVVIYHYFFRYNEIFGHDRMTVSWAYWGKFGVELFFLISGFVIFISLSKTKRPLDFIVSRFARLYPAYIFSVVFTFIVVTCFGLEGRGVSVTEAVGNLFILHEYLRIPHVDGVYWTLTVEVTFYFIMLVFYIFNKLDKVELYLTCVVLISIFSSFGFFDINKYIYKILIIKHLSLFLMGILVYKKLNFDFSLLQWACLVVNIFNISVVYDFIGFIFVLCVLFLFFISVRYRPLFLDNRIFIFLGSVSYPLYLIHQNFGYIIIGFLLSYSFSAFFSIVVAVFFSIFVSWVILVFIERPIQFFIRSKYVCFVK